MMGITARDILDGFGFLALLVSAWFVSDALATIATEVTR